MSSMIFEFLIFQARDGSRSESQVKEEEEEKNTRLLNKYVKGFLKKSSILITSIMHYLELKLDPKNLQKYWLPKSLLILTPFIFQEDNFANIFFYLIKFQRESLK